MTEPSPQLRQDILDDLEELRDYVGKLAADAKSAERRARVMKQMAARAAETLTDLERRVTKQHDDNE